MQGPNISAEKISCYNDIDRWLIGNFYCKLIFFREIVFYLFFWKFFFFGESVDYGEKNVGHQRLTERTALFGVSLQSATNLFIGMIR